MRVVLTRNRTAVTRYRPRRWLSRNWKVYEVTVGNATFVLVAKKYWGVSVWSRISESGTVLLCPFATCYSEVVKMKKKKQAASTTDAAHLAAMESQVFAKLHPIIAHCAETRYDDGDTRKAGWVTIKTMGSAWVIEAKDPDTCARLTVVQSSLDDALALLSVLLESEEAPWEHDQWLAQQQAKAKKK